MSLSQRDLPTPDSVSRVTPLVVLLAALSIRHCSIRSQGSPHVFWDPWSFLCIAPGRLSLPAASSGLLGLPSGCQGLLRLCTEGTHSSRGCPSPASEHSTAWLCGPLCLQRFPLCETCLLLYPAWPSSLHSPSSVFWNTSIIVSQSSSPKPCLRTCFWRIQPETIIIFLNCFWYPTGVYYPWEWCLLQ